MGPVQIHHNSHHFAIQFSHSVDLARWQAKMASIEIWIPWRDAHKPRLPPSPVDLWRDLGGKLKWLPLGFGHVDVSPQALFISPSSLFEILLVTNCSLVQTSKHRKETGKVKNLLVKCRTSYDCNIILKIQYEANSDCSKKKKRRGKKISL